MRLAPVSFLAAEVIWMRLPKMPMPATVVRHGRQ